MTLTEGDPTPVNTPTAAPTDRMVRALHPTYDLARSLPGASAFAAPLPSDPVTAGVDDRTWLRWVEPIAVVVVLGALGLLLHRTRTLGHWWGDDWALYIRQANGLLDLDPSRVADQNAFTVDASAGAPFSPPIYPWGYPAVLSVAIPLVGSGVDQLGIVGVLAAVVFGACWYRLARPRLGVVPALVSMIAVCFAPQLTSWSDLIQSELVFMAAVGLFMVALDRHSREGTLLAATTPIWTLVGIGLLAGFAFEVRREGLATIAAIGTAHLVHLVGARRELGVGSLGQRWGVGARLAAPYLGFAAFVGMIKLMFPAVLVPRYPGSGIGNVWTQRAKHVRHFADLIGIKNPYKPEPSVFGSVTAGKAILAIWGAILLIALVLAITRWRRTEAHLAAYVVVAFIIGCSASAALSRYFASVVPLCSLLVLTTIAAAGRFLVSRRRPRPDTYGDFGEAAAYPVPVPATRWRHVVVGLITIGVVAPMAGYNIKVLVDRGTKATISRDNDLYQWGAQHPDAQEMFDWVRSHTRPTDIIASFKARSMVLETGRNAVQVDDYRPLGDVEVAVVVLERTGRRYAEFVEDQGWTRVWANQRLAVFAPEGSPLIAELPE